MELIISLVFLLFFGSILLSASWHFFKYKNKDYVAWMSTKSEIYLEVYGHKEMTQSTKDKIAEASLRIDVGV